MSSIYGQAKQAGNETVVKMLEEAGAKPPPPAEVKLSEEQLARFAGTFFVEEQPAMEGVIGLEDGALFFQFMGQPKLVLEPTAAATFRAASGFPLEMTFDDGEPAPAFTYTQDGMPQPARFLRKADEAVVADAESSGDEAGEPVADSPAETKSASTEATQGGGHQELAGVPRSQRRGYRSGANADALGP